MTDNAELQRQAVMIAGLTLETKAQTLALKAIIKKIGLTQQDIMNELNADPVLASLPFDERNQLVGAINDFFR